MRFIIMFNTAVGVLFFVQVTMAKENEYLSI